MLSAHSFPFVLDALLTLFHVMATMLVTVAPQGSYENIPVDEPTEWSDSAAPALISAHSRSQPSDTSDSGRASWTWTLSVLCLSLACWALTATLLLTLTPLSAYIRPATVLNPSLPSITDSPLSSTVPLPSLSSSSIPTSEPNANAHTATDSFTATASAGLPSRLFPVGRLSPLDCYGVARVNWSDVCNSSQWETIINVVLSSHEQRDHSTASQPQAKDSGTRRMYRVILKLLCGHPIIVGATGTSVSCGHGSLPQRKEDPHLFVRMIHRYLSSIRPLIAINDTMTTNAANSSLGYWNGCMGGSGSDTASVCLGSIFDARSFYTAHQQPDATSQLPMSTFLPPSDDPSPELRHPQYLTSAQYATHYNLSSIVPDLLLVEFVANDARATGGRTFGSVNLTRKQALQIKTDNMARLLQRIWDFPTAAPLLINSVVSLKEVEHFIAIEQIYSMAQAPHHIPSLDLRHHLGLHSALSESEQLSPTEAATWSTWGNELISDGLHPNLVGHLTVAIMFSRYFNQLINDLTDTMQYFSSLAGRIDSLAPADDMTVALEECSAVLLNSSGSAGFGVAASPHSWSHPYSEDAICAMRWSIALNADVLTDESVVSSYMFQYAEEASQKRLNKWAWSARVRSARLNIRLMPISQNQTVTGFSFAFLCSDSAEMSTSAMAWISATRPEDGQSVNVSDIVTVNSKWAWRQTTITVKEVPFSIPAAEFARLSEPVVHFVNDDDHKFSLVGVFVRSESSNQRGST